MLNKYPISLYYTEYSLSVSLHCRRKACSPTLHLTLSHAVCCQAMPLLTPCTRSSRGDQCHAHHVGGQLGLRVLTPRRLKCTLSLHNTQHRVNIKTHSEIAHQYGALKIFLLMTSGEMGQYVLRVFKDNCSPATSQSGRMRVLRANWRAFGSFRRRSSNLVL